MQGKRVLLMVVSLGLIVVSASFAQDLSEFQKQMMQRMMEQNREKFQKGEEEAPGFTKIDRKKETADQGKALFNDPSLGTNGKSCGSCHQEGQKPLDGRQVNHHLVAFVQYCYEHALAGKKVIEKDKLDKIMSYFVLLRIAKSAPQIQTPPHKQEELW